jgi:hypothetical protein
MISCTDLNPSLKLIGLMSSFAKIYPTYQLVSKTAESFKYFPDLPDINKMNEQANNNKVI